MNGYLLDTNVLSELIAPRPDPHVVAWMRGRRPDRMHVASLTVGELRRGAAKLGDTKRGTGLGAWIDDLVVEFGERIVPFDLRAAQRWGRMMGESDRAGAPLPPMDAQIAAVAIEYGLTPVTRNVRDFARMVDDVVNPFELERT